MCHEFSRPAGHEDVVCRILHPDERGLRGKNLEKSRDTHGVRLTSLGRPSCSSVKVAGISARASLPLLVFLLLGLPLHACVGVSCVDQKFGPPQRKSP